MISSIWLFYVRSDFTKMLCRVTDLKKIVFTANLSLARSLQFRIQRCESLYKKIFTRFACLSPAYLLLHFVSLFSFVPNCFFLFRHFFSKFEIFLRFLALLRNFHSYFWTRSQTRHTWKKRNKKSTTKESYLRAASVNVSGFWIRDFHFHISSNCYTIYLLLIFQFTNLFI